LKAQKKRALIVSSVNVMGVIFHAEEITWLAKLRNLPLWTSVTVFFVLTPAQAMFIFLSGEFIIGIMSLVRHI